jgi:N-acetylmuramic acid 6-phosphate etherase
MIDNVKSPVAVRCKNELARVVEEPMKRQSSAPLTPTALPDPRHGSRLTEQRNPRSRRIDHMSPAEALAAMHAEDREALGAVERCAPRVAAAIDRVVESFRRGGRLIYVGAGTSGRLGVLDASEQPPTFGVPPTMVQGIIAGGRAALTRSIEGAEDHAEEGAAAIDEREVDERDTVFGITTGGRAAFVLGALAEARRRRAATVLLTCTPALEGESDLADVQIHALVGPEIVTGSTRLKAGTATKLILNQVSTLAMIRIGKVYENLMVDLRPVNAKLADRSRRILIELTGLEPEAAEAVLNRAGHLKTALVMELAGVDREAAERRLKQAEGRVAEALGMRPDGWEAAES